MCFVFYSQASAANWQTINVFEKAEYLIDYDGIENINNQTKSVWIKISLYQPESTVGKMHDTKFYFSTLTESKYFCFTKVSLYNKNNHVYSEDFQCKYTKILPGTLPDQIYSVLFAGTGKVE